MKGVLWRFPERCNRFFAFSVDFFRFFGISNNINRLWLIFDEYDAIFAASTADGGVNQALFPRKRFIHSPVFCCSAACKGGVSPKIRGNTSFRPNIYVLRAIHLLRLA